MHLTRPLKGGAPSLIVIFSLGLTIAEKAGLLGLALGLILSSWFWKYAFILFDYTARGVPEPPALDIQMVNPVDEQRPLALLFILCSMYAVCHALVASEWARMAFLVGAVFVLCLPAIVAVLALERNIVLAINPNAWYRLIRELGWHYLLALGVAALYAILLNWIWAANFWRPVQLATTLFCSLSLFSLLAGLLYDHRDQIGLEVWHSPERTRARGDSEDLSQSAKVIDEAYGQMRAGKHVAAWKIITDWLSARNHRIADYAWLCQRVETWGDARYRTRLTEDFLEKLLTTNGTGQALDVLTRTIRRDRNFRPKSGQSTLRLAHVAAAGGSPKLALLLVEDFAARFPDDANIGAAGVLSSRLKAQGIGAP